MDLKMSCMQLLMGGQCGIFNNDNKKEFLQLLLHLWNLLPKDNMDVEMGSRDN